MAWAALLFMVTLSLTLFAFSQRDANDAALSARRALCLQRYADQSSLASTRHLLKVHPDFLRRLGLSKSDLSERSTRNQIKALSDIDCSGVARPK